MTKFTVPRTPFNSPTNSKKNTSKIRKEPVNGKKEKDSGKHSTKRFPVTKSTSNTLVCPNCKAELNLSQLENPPKKTNDKEQQETTNKVAPSEQPKSKSLKQQREAKADTGATVTCKAESTDTSNRYITKKNSSDEPKAPASSQTFCTQTTADESVNVSIKSNKHKTTIIENEHAQKPLKSQKGGRKTKPKGSKKSVRAKLKEHLNQIETLRLLEWADKRNQAIQHAERIRKLRQVGVNVNAIEAHKLPKKSSRKKAQKVTRKKNVIQSYSKKGNAAPFPPHEQRPKTSYRSTPRHKWNKKKSPLRHRKLKTKNKDDARLVVAIPKAESEDTDKKEYSSKTSDGDLSCSTDPGKHSDLLAKEGFEAQKSSFSMKIKKIHEQTVAELDNMRPLSGEIVDSKENVNNKTWACTCGFENENLDSTCILCGDERVHDTKCEQSSKEELCKDDDDYEDEFDDSYSMDSFASS